MGGNAGIVLVPIGIESFFYFAAYLYLFRSKLGGNAGKNSPQSYGVSFFITQIFDKIDSNAAGPAANTD